MLHECARLLHLLLPVACVLAGAVIVRWIVE